jgi:hypothetical protein
MEGDTVVVPAVYAQKVRGKLGPLWDMLPDGAITHDHHAYLNSDPDPVPHLIAVGPPSAVESPPVPIGAH